MRFIGSALLLALAATAQSLNVPRSHVAHEEHIATPRWSRRERIPSSLILPVRIGLKQSNLHKGEDLLMDISDPSSPNYGKHWSAEQVTAMFAPEQNTVDFVKKWLNASGIAYHRVGHSDNKGWLAFDATADEIENLLYTQYHIYEHVASGSFTAATKSKTNYHVPRDIQHHIDYITPGVKMESSAKASRRKRNAVSTKLPLRLDDVSKCNELITPACLRALYGIPKSPHYRGGKPRADNALGVFEWTDFYAQEDLDLFFTNYYPSIPNGTHPTLASINGATAPTKNISQAGEESDLDFTLIYPLIYPQNVTLFQTDTIYHTINNTEYKGLFNTFLDGIDGSYCNYTAFGETGNDPVHDPTYPGANKFNYTGGLQCGVYKPTNVLSISYDGVESVLPAYYQERQCNEFLKLGLQGVSVLFASGDNGVAAYDLCTGANETVFAVGWPNNCPWVTNVGATQVDLGRSVLEPEIAARNDDDDYASGGGFSNLYSIPKYQRETLASYFKHYKPPYPSYSLTGNASVEVNRGVYNRNGRGFPDVAANGQNIAVYTGGEFQSTAGTSASAPIFASILNRINEERLTSGKSTVGFVNPALYANPWVMNDITSGNNPGCGTVGFSAVPGWDPVTGLGTPNFPKLRSFFNSLP